MNSYVPSNPTMHPIQSKDVFGVELPFACHALREALLPDYVPAIDPSYQFDATITSAILAGLMFNKKTLVYGPHGTGKSSHIEQVAARLSWPTLRVNLDGHLSRMELVGRETIMLKDGKQITDFREGLLPWAMRRPVLLVLDEYDAARPDLLFVLQRLLESESKLTLFETGEVIVPHPFFRLMATANTITNASSYHYSGTHSINQAQLDRWHIIAPLAYMPFTQEKAWLQAKCPDFPVDHLDAHLRFAQLTRQAESAGDIALAMSPRSALSWAENYCIFQNRSLALEVSYLSRLEKEERQIVAEYYQRCFNEEII